MLLAQIASQIERLRALNLDLRVRGIAGSKRMLLAENGHRPRRNGRELLAEKGEPLDLEKFAAHCPGRLHPAHRADRLHGERRGRRPLSGLAGARHPRGDARTRRRTAVRCPYYRALQGRGARRAARTTSTRPPWAPDCRSSRRCAICARPATTITRIEGIFSGTLAYLFNVFDGSESFSSIVRAAKQKGYTEPDPRDDLSGMDVARKLIILGREMGLTLEMSDVEVAGLVPEALDGCSVEEFMARPPEFDAAMARRLAGSEARGQVLRYVGRVDADGKATVGLTRLDARHAFANIALTDNVVRFATRRYCDNPLIVQGPGAGPEVTAGGVFSDLLRLSAYLGAHL